MQATNRTLITIVTEASLENRLARELDEFGVHGYTIIDARGKGARGLRSGDWDVESNIRVEVICSEQIALDLMNHLQDKYYDNFAMITYSHEVFVLRPEKF
ncbi:transcriptional regulator [uncultured Umboniibacter sp.]|uniref:P-II family nitrogen regulator n=1 Tax=uncultured Umboniibacter sp. TaxID=1798917 RepID=UPI0026259D1D|nr:transcriptional regulator [uncultured Umboniibacter sp.]